MYKGKEEKNEKAINFNSCFYNDRLYQQRPYQGNR